MSFLDPKYDTVSPYEEKIMEAEAKAFNEARDELIAKFLAEGRKKEAKRLKKATKPQGCLSKIVAGIFLFVAAVFGRALGRLVVDNAFETGDGTAVVVFAVIIICTFVIVAWYRKSHPADEEQEWARLLIRNYMLEKSGKPIDGSDKSSRYSVFKR